MNTSCLTYKELSGYAENKLLPSEKNKIYNHLITCELCSNAVNGFGEQAFSINEIVAINQIIETKFSAHPLTFSKVLVVVTSLISIFGFYFFANSFSYQKKLNVHNNEPKTVPATYTNNTTSIFSTTNETPAYSEKQTTTDPSVLKTFYLIPEQLNSIEITRIENNSIHLPPAINQSANGDFYIHNFKVVNYFNLYFKLKQNTTVRLPGYASNVENKYVLPENYDDTANQTVELKKILEDGLAYLKNNQFEKAENCFSFLLHINPLDENAAFYKGLIRYSLSDYTAAITYFEKEPQSSQQGFYEESKWYTALCYLKLSMKQDAELILNEIVKENGFYSEKATVLLKQI